MIIVKIEGKETLDKALKKMKKKWNDQKTVRELRDRKAYKKKSVKRREEIQKAKYVQKKFGDE